MARLFLTPIDLGKLELLNPRLQQLASDPGSPVTGQFYYNTSTNTVRFWNGTVWADLGRLDQITAPTASVALNNQKLTGVGTPTAATDGATKGYVDGLVQGLAWKDSVRAATLVNGTLASAYANGSIIDGVTLATGDRILLKNQSAGAENGIYTVNGAGAPTRAEDADVGAELYGMAVFVQEGTLGDSAWVLQTNAPITVGTTSLAFAQFGAGTSYVEGTGIDIAGNTISLEVPVTVPRGGTGAVTFTTNGVLLGNGVGVVGATGVGSAGQVLRGTGTAPAFGSLVLTTDVTGILPVANGGTGAATLASNGVLLGNGTGVVAATGVGAANTVLRGTAAAPVFGQVVLTTDVTGVLPIANGGTGGATAAAAKTALGFMGRHSQAYGDGVATTITITHNLNTLDVIVRVFRVSDGVEVEVDVTHATVNTVNVSHAVAPTSNQYRVVVVG